LDKNKLFLVDFMVFRCQYVTSDVHAWIRRHLPMSVYLFSSLLVLSICTCTKFFNQNFICSFCAVKNYCYVKKIV